MGKNKKKNRTNSKQEGGGATATATATDTDTDTTTGANKDTAVSASPNDNGDSAIAVESAAAALAETSISPDGAITKEETSPVVLPVDDTPVVVVKGTAEKTEAVATSTSNEPDAVPAAAPDAVPAAPDAAVAVVKDDVDSVSTKKDADAVIITTAPAVATADTPVPVASTEEEGATTTSTTNSTSTAASDTPKDNDSCAETKNKRPLPTKKKSVTFKEVEKSDKEEAHEKEKERNTNINNNDADNNNNNTQTQIFVPCPSIENDDDESFETTIRPPGRTLWQRKMTLYRTPKPTEETHGTVKTILKKESSSNNNAVHLGATDNKGNGGEEQTTTANAKSKENNNKKVALLFVHGSCAASQQFEGLLEALGDQLKNGFQADDFVAVATDEEEKEEDEEKVSSKEKEAEAESTTTSDTNANNEEGAYVNAEDANVQDAQTETKENENENDNGTGTGTVDTQDAPVPVPAPIVPDISVSNIDVLQCHLFDALGCGNSRPTPFLDRNVVWKDYAAKEMLLDLEFMYRSTISSLTKDKTPLFIISHSYGTSQVVQLLNALRRHEHEHLQQSGGESSGKEDSTSMIRGLVFMGGALKDCPSAPQTVRDGGARVFGMPLFGLKMMKSSMTKNFLDQAYYYNNSNSQKDNENDEDVTCAAELQKKTSRMEFSMNNSMKMCQAFYRQQRYATSVEARSAVMVVDKEVESKSKDDDAEAEAPSDKQEPKSISEKQQQIVVPVKDTKEGTPAPTTTTIDESTVLESTTPPPKNEKGEEEEQPRKDEEPPKVLFPSLVIHGKHDGVFSLDTVGTHFATSLPGATLKVIPNASHQAFEEQPRQVAASILQFISENLMV
jgi:pimeloyl-ACP methyl ester carboxylesterase